jgi:hypothetical protein
MLNRNCEEWDITNVRCRTSCYKPSGAPVRRAAMLGVSAGDDPDHCVAANGLQPPLVLLTGFGGG